MQPQTSVTKYTKLKTNIDNSTVCKHLEKEFTIGKNKSWTVH